MNWPDNAFVRRALFVSAICRWQSMVWLGIIVIATGYIATLGVQSIGWPLWVAMASLLIGLTGEGIFVYLYVTNMNRQAVIKTGLFEESVYQCINCLHDKQLQARLLKTSRYWLRIHETIDALESGAMYDRLKHLKQDSTHWLEMACTLATRLDSLKMDIVSDPDLFNMLNADQDAVPKVLAESTSVKDNLASMSEQLDTIMAAFREVHVGLHLIKNQRYKHGRITRLQEEIYEQANQLNDLLMVMRR